MSDLSVYQSDGLWKETVQMSVFCWCTELCSAYQTGGAGTGCVQGVTAEVLNGGQVGTMIFFLLCQNHLSDWLELLTSCINTLAYVLLVAARVISVPPPLC